jgi:hypothetical protein
MGLEEFLVWLFAIVFRLWLKISQSFKSMDIPVCFGLTTYFLVISCICIFLKEFDDSSSIVDV